MRGRRAVVGVAVVALVASCGLPDDREPRVIAAADAPLDLGQVPGEGNPSTGEGDDEVTLFFVRQGLLREVTRQAEDDALQPTIVLLLAGPTASESTLSTTIPPETVLNAAEIDGATAILDFGCTAGAVANQCGLLGVQGQDQLTLFGQLVCTTTGVPGVENVRFLQEGQPQDAPTDGGTIRSPTPVTCDDYRSLQR